MATTTIKSTYSLDVETVRQLEAMARRWKVSKSEALRRAIRAAASQQPATEQEALDALQRLQDTIGLSDQAAGNWEDRIRSERRAAARRRNS
jgi:hypothetical protein